MASTTRVDNPLRSTPPPPSPEPAARLRLRAMSGWEEEYVERHLSEPNTARLCNEVLARCLVPPGHDPGDARQVVRDLLVAERDRELVALRRLSLGPDVHAHVVCPECGATSDAAFSLDALPLDLPVVPRRITVELPDVGEVVLRLPTAGDQEELLDTDLETEAERLSWFLARCVERWGDADARFDLTAARDLPVGVRRALDGALNDAVPALDLEMAIDCSHCGAPTTSPFGVMSFFFWN